MNPYGCHNRAEFRAVLPVQDGWWLDGKTRVPKMHGVPFRMARECHYTHTDLGQADARCTGCKWRAEKQSSNQNTAAPEPAPLLGFQRSDGRFGRSPGATVIAKTS